MTPDAQIPLTRWHTVMRRENFRNWKELRTVFPSADFVDAWVVFNIGGNKYRLITAIHFDRGRVFVRHVLTHQEYDKEGWKK
ncbi:MAG: hypothetical protein DCC52_12525 [Chloroflexi bacterium]|nr:MAG: hypothetical protein DCC52_12525 [Chloroflexota bacterium]